MRKFHFVLRTAALVQGALERLGAPVTAGQLEGEYCAGAHSLHAGGVKVAGIAQRVVKGAALISTAVLVDAGPSLRAVLVDVYAALGIDWRPQTAGSLADVAAAPSLAALAEQLAPDALAPGGLEPEDHRRALELEATHRA